MGKNIRVSRRRIPREQQYDDGAPRAAEVPAICQLKTIAVSGALPPVEIRNIIRRHARFGRVADQIRMEFFRMIGGAIDVEQMPFHLVKKEENFEVRNYDQVVVAETVDDGNSAFRTLARYIGVFGTPENRVRAADGDPTNHSKIAMTAPVINQTIANERIDMTSPVLSSNAGSSTMAFVLPKEYKTVDSAPIPLNKNVRLRTLPKRKCAVMQFTWNVSEKQGEEKAKTFIKALQEKGYETGNWQLARYNPPFTIPFLRTNEIIVELRNGGEPGKE